MTRVLVVTPTYNERESLPVAYERLRAAVPSADWLVVDDGSPDGTGDIADAWAAEDDAVHVLHRTGKLGLGTAYIAGFRWAIDRGYDVVVEMDADGSHRPEDLPRLLAALDDPAVDGVVGSRWIPGGRVVNWPWNREVLSRGANVYARLAIGMPIHDATGGFRAYRTKIIAALDLDAIDSRGYSFQVDMTWRIIRGGGHLVEVPITFVEREVGESKMSGSIIREAFVKVAVWGAQHRTEQVRGLLKKSAGKSAEAPADVS
ncbi:polyprenol monophosphomannose synthase [Luteimicrobium subarcticum]|uniref:Dolichol-phosphate mannosyltransferase n=1 Tax=Luteimicrobium subarcticum TaxID=620910 RepID=A0A2M8W3Q5_9MICO|nr:dolichol-phosphate mannosyltransferase [Luteimicrobium subarcticum]